MYDSAPFAFTLGALHCLSISDGCEPKLLASILKDVPEVELAQALRERVQVAAAGVEFLPGLRFIAAPGHRPGHSALMCESEGALLVHLADTMGAAILLEHPDWHWAYDTVPAQAARDQALVLQLAAERQALVFGPHLPYPGVGHVLPLGNGFRWLPVDQKS